MVSVVIPTLNEANYLSAALDSVGDSQAQKEVIVVDAGSVDGTLEIAERKAARLLISSRKQRAHQMNLGAKHAHGSILLFLHADTILPRAALDRIESSLSKERVIGGGFARRYDSSSWFLGTTCLLASLRTRWTGWFLGDQAIFIRRKTFEELGGFRDLDLFEDSDLSRRMAKFGQVVTLLPPVISSARRFKVRGEVLTTLSDLWLTCCYLAGADPNALAKARRTVSEEKPSSGDSRVKQQALKS
jgi:rSAM/selenodomain-associated transferase 2